MSLAFSRFHREQRPWVLGHRGARFIAPENTIAAFQAALEQGADGIELDVRMTGEQEVVVFHDATLTRMTGGYDRRTIEGLRGAELARVRLFGETIPTFSDFLAWAGDNSALVNIELKHDVVRPKELVRRVVEQLRSETGLSDRILLSCFHPRVVHELSSALPGVPVGWLFQRRQRWGSYLPAITALGATAVHPEYPLLSERRVRLFRRRGLLVNCWTVNSARTARKAEQLGVDAVITDMPAHIRQALETPAKPSVAAI